MSQSKRIQKLREYYSSEAYLSSYAPYYVVKKVREQLKDVKIPEDITVEYDSGDLVIIFEDIPKYNEKNKINRIYHIIRKVVAKMNKEGRWTETVTAMCSKHETKEGMKIRYDYNLLSHYERDSYDELRVKCVKEIPYIINGMMDIINEN